MKRVRGVMLAMFLCCFLVEFFVLAGEVVLCQVTPCQRIVYRDGEKIWQRLIRIEGEKKWLDESLWKAIPSTGSREGRT